MQQTKEQLEAWSANSFQDDNDADVDDGDDDDDDDEDDDDDNVDVDDDDDDDDALQSGGKASPRDGLERQILSSKSWSVASHIYLMYPHMNTLQHK